MKRSSGILLPLSSLPSPHGIGTMGKSAYEFVDFLKDAGQSWWQLLPLSPSNCGNSPYSSYSAFAGNPNYIDLDFLAKDWIITRKSISAIDFGNDEESVDYAKVNAGRELLLRSAFERSRSVLENDIRRFRDENPWAENYSLYMAAKKHFGMLPWMQWEDRELRFHRPEAVEKYSRLLREEMDYHCFVQMLFYRQWEQLKTYANEKGIRFMGDMPIYVALDSADVWSEPEFFQLDSEGCPTAVAGCPPDDFTAEGQLWGNPLYNWDRMREDGYGWWIRRIGNAEKLYDALRIDHFRGLDEYWAVPADEKTAVNGSWQKGPGMGLAGVLGSWFNNMTFVIEDLGLLSDSVRELVKASGFPNMAVLQFAFDVGSDSVYLPHNCRENSVCYIGTHDNDTVSGWVKTRSREELRFARDYMHITDDEGWSWGMIRTGMATACTLFIARMQDVLDLPESCRINIPGVAEGNWHWRLKKGAASKKTARKLLEYTKRYRRL